MAISLRSSGTHGDALDRRVKAYLQKDFVGPRRVRGVKHLVPRQSRLKLRVQDRDVGAGGQRLRIDRVRPVTDHAEAVARRNRAHHSPLNGRRPAAPFGCKGVLNIQH